MFRTVSGNHQDVSVSIGTAAIDGGVDWRVEGDKVQNTEGSITPNVDDQLTPCCEPNAECQLINAMLADDSD